MQTVEFTSARLQTRTPLKRSQETPRCSSTVRILRQFIVTVTTNAYYQQHQTVPTTFLMSLSAAAVDLDAAVIPDDNITVAQGDELKATCNALSSLPTRTTWFKVTYAHTVQLHRDRQCFSVNYERLAGI